MPTHFCMTCSTCGTYCPLCGTCKCKNKQEISVFTPPKLGDDKHYKQLFIQAMKLLDEFWYELNIDEIEDEDWIKKRSYLKDELNKLK